MKHCYTERVFRASTLAFIGVLNQIIIEYQKMGYTLTVRQLYYQCVARGLIPNTMQEYKRMANTVNEAKLAGLLDWSAIEDRTREFVRRSRWSSGRSILDSCISSYHQDMWANQENRVFVIVEKEALVGVLATVCNKYDVPLLAARGYPSGTVLREFAVDDLQDAERYGQRVQVLHLGDHDPSGIDMSRDLSERLTLFSGIEVNVQRLALNMEQIEELRPPENPAKMTDSRFESYRRNFGDKSWELDALKPTYLAELVGNNISRYIDDDSWYEVEKEIADVRHKIQTFAESWE
jgi:hypothetical protein